MKIPLLNILRSIVTILLLCASVILFAKHFKVLDISNGLSNNTVKCITQDKYGFIWLGTFDGLCRFDGVKFTIFKHNPQDSLSIMNNHIESMLAVEDGIWIGTQVGLNFYSFKESRSYSCECLIRDNKKKMSEAIRNIVQVDGKIYVLSDNHKLFVLSDSHKYLFKQCDWAENDLFWAVTPYKNSHILAQTSDGLCLIDPKKKKIVSRLNLKERVVSYNTLYYSPNNDMVYLGYGFGNESKAFKIDSNLIIEKKHIAVPSDIKAVIDYKNETLFGTDGKGLVSYSEDKLETLMPANSNISSDAIHSLFVDREDNLWVGTYRGGVNLYSPYYDWFKSISATNKKLTYNVVTAILQHEKLLYLGMDGGGLNIYNPATESVVAYTTQNSGIAGNNILSLASDGQYIWMGVYGKGLCSFSPIDGKFKIYPLPFVVGNGSNYIWQIKDDGKGYIWVLSDKVYRFDKKEYSYSLMFDYLNASGVVFDEKYTWISSTIGGFYQIDRLSKKMLVHYSTDSSTHPISENNVRYIFADSKHNLWFATEYLGLNKLDTSSGQIVLYGSEQGLTDSHIVGIQEDNSGYLWMSSNNGLFRYDPTSDIFLRFGKDDNLPALQFNYNACFQEGGRMYFGSTGGLVWFVPDEIKYANISDSVCFTQLELLNSERKSIPLYGSNPEEIELTYDQNFFTISFSLPEMLTPEKVRFSCYMKNFENDWIEVGNNRQVSYTNVPPGEYVFCVKSSDKEGRWTEIFSSLRIIITPPWWKTNWAICLWCAIGLSILFLIFWIYRHELNIKHLVQMKELEKDTARNINEAKLRFYTNITHELRTPIFLITSPIEELLSSSDKTVVQVPKYHLMAMFRNAMKLNKLISRIIDFRKLESGKLRLELQRLNVVTFCRNLTEDYEALCLQKDIIFHFLPAKTIIQLDFDTEKMEIIISNLISNAFKYTPDGGKIELSIDETDDAVSFVVTDNGIGIRKEFQEAIFERFFQVDPTQTTSESDGIGLSFVKHLVELHDGVVRVESEPDRGSKFIFDIPKYLIKEDIGEMMVKESIIEESLEKTTSIAVTSALSPAATHTILLIDDEMEILEMLERLLINDFKVLKAKNAIDGLELAQKELPDIIICDVMMPKMSGTDFVSILKADKKLLHIPIIMLTAKTSEEDKMVAFDCGADAYLTKPISLKYLRKRIEHLLARTESAEVVNVLAQTNKNYTKEEQRFLLKCREIVDDNLTNPDFDIVFLAEKLDMSHSTMYRKMKAITGMSVIEFINEYRIFKAVQLFKLGETNISTVCVKCGFNDIKNFRDAFKKKMQISPKQYVMQL
ncbi:MAG: ATP-binding protein [Anaerovoracaceae bacterium]